MEQMIKYISIANKYFEFILTEFMTTFGGDLVEEMFAFVVTS